jgi:uncharacterized RDD family membrane protein YckC
MDEVKYAGFWLRTLAAIIDTILFCAVIFTVLYFLVGPQVFDNSSDYMYSMTYFLFEWIIPITIVIVFWITKSATPGKMVLNMKIVDVKTLGSVPTSRLLLRYLGYYIAAIPLGLGFMWVGWDKRKQGWHDKIAGTVVIKTR